MPADPSRIITARQMLAHLGLTPADLAAHPDLSRRIPTLADYIPRVAAAASPGTRRTYGTYWNRMAATLGHLRLDEVTASDIEALMRQVTATARTRRTSRHGRHAGEHVIAAARAVYRRAIADGYIALAASPAHRVAKPRRLPNPRRALTPGELQDINLVARTSGNDVILDALLLRLHTETACRRGGALALRLADLDTRHCLIRLTEKGGTLRWQPITSTLANRFLEHAEARGAVLPADRLLRYRNGRPISSRRYDHLWKRIGKRLPWVAAHGISTHWLRHTTLTWVERHFGYGVARAYAGHTDRRGPATTTYIKIDPPCHRRGPGRHDRRATPACANHRADSRPIRAGPRANRRGGRV
ncbi:site-specific integrase [Micromonospora sp. DR5-3]|uniref:tyrosine-type recombinase/integrase n=1 Tax=unclassified Micromonospora TaxID=2617518 RepID=UPI002102A025|nr:MULTISPECIES: site-specific integrase [unclassified Micromonospora]MCW3818814.1 site-specific integrase [Micromonospora sp. DR5-3]